MDNHDLPPVPARIVNEFVYCPRLAYLEWIDHRFTDNADTVEGRFVHRRVDRARGRPPAPDAPEARPASTALTIESERLGVAAKLDLLESSDGGVVAIEYKRGSPRSPDEPLWPPERVQLALQVLLLEDLGYTVDGAMVFFAETRTRHTITLSRSDLAEARAAVEGVRAMAREAVLPPPLVDSPKCPRCSLVGLCLPDETNLLAGRTAAAPRRLVVSDPDATPLYVTTPGSRVTKRKGRVVLKEQGQEVASRRLIDVSHVALFGNADIGSALMRECFDHGIPVLWLTMGGWLSGLATGMPAGNVAVRMRQHRAAAVGGAGLPQLFVSGKIRNQRTMLRRHAGETSATVVGQLKRLAAQAASAEALPSLLGIEGTAARLYFGQFGSMLRGPLAGEFAFEGRNRRPPLDPVNAVMSFLAALLAKDATIALAAAGLDPYVGLLHQPRFGRPSLALDLAEEFRPLVVDSTVLMLINNGEVRHGDFVVRAGGWALTATGRRGVIAAYERRMQQTLCHPTFGYVASYRRTLEIQARMIAASLVGDVPDYRPLTTR